MKNTRTDGKIAKMATLLLACEFMRLSQSKTTGECLDQRVGLKTEANFVYRRQAPRDQGTVGKNGYLAAKILRLSKMWLVL